MKLATFLRENRLIHGGRCVKLPDSIIRIVSRSPGIEFGRLYKRIGQDFITAPGLETRLKTMVAERLLETLWDAREQRFRYYIYGTAPAMVKKNDRPRGAWQDNHPMNKARGERFRMEFDEAFGLLYCDLKIMAGAMVVMEGCGASF